MTRDRQIEHDPGYQDAVRAQRRAYRLWGYRGATVRPHPHALFPVYEVGRLYYLPDNGARFVSYGKGPSWRAAFAMAKKRGKVP